MEFKIVEHYYPVTLTIRSQLGKAKRFFKKIPQHRYNRQHDNKIDEFFLSCQLHIQS